MQNLRGQTRGVMVVSEVAYYAKEQEKKCLAPKCEGTVEEAEVQVLRCNTIGSFDFLLLL